MRRTTLDLGPLPDALGYMLRRAQIKVFAGFHAAFDRDDIRPAQYSVLVVIGRNPGVLASEISQALAIKPANLAPMVADFETRGLIRREKLAHDRRSHGLFLSADGVRFVKTLERRQKALEARIIRAFGARERGELIALLVRLTAAADLEPDEETVDNAD